MDKCNAVAARIVFAIFSAAAMFAGQALAANTAAASWATMDADADGTLSPGEVAGTPWQAPFEKMDSNADGKVTKTEFQALMASREDAQSGDTGR